MSQLKIAVIDDATMIRDLVKKFIRQNFKDAKVFEADNGQNAIKMLSRQPIDIILCDWEMPEMDGEELLKWVRSEEKLKNKPFIMVTSRGDREFVQKAIQSQVSDYLVKPFNTKQFLEKIYKACKRHGFVIPKNAFITPPSSIASADSLSVLTAGRTLVNDKPKPKTPAKPMAKGMALIRTPDGELRCAIKQLDLNSMTGIFKVADYLPKILDQVSLDIEFRQNEESKTVRINGFIQSLKAQETKPDSERVFISVRFVDEDPQKRALISEYVGQFG